MPLPDFSTYTTRELLAGYVGILNELLERGVIRTRNAPLGDLAEHIALKLYGGLIEPNSAKSYDLIAHDGQRVQVKARTLPTGKKTGSFSIFRSFDFEIVLLIAFDWQSYDIQWARELTKEEAMSIARRVEHTNGWICTTSAVSQSGTDVTEAVRRILEKLDVPALEATDAPTTG